MIRNILIFVISLLPICLSALNWTIEDIDNFDLNKPTISVDNNGRAYIVGHSYAGWHEIVRYIENSGGAWQLDSLPISVCDSIAYNCRTSSARGSDGSLHILYRVRVGTYGWPVYANDTSGSFASADSLFTNTSESSYHYGIAVDNENRAHIVCEVYNGSSFSLKYYAPYADSVLLISTPAGDGSIAIDKNNVVHIAFIYPAYPQTNPRIYYTNNETGSFSAPQLVFDSLGVDPSIAVDTMGNAYISWTQTNGSPVSDLYCADNRTGSFITTNITKSATLNEAWSHIALSAQGDVGILFNPFRSGQNSSDIKVAFRAHDDSVFAVDSVTLGFWNPSWGSITWNDRSIAIDQAGYVHIVFISYDGSGPVTCYAKALIPQLIAEGSQTSMGSEFNLKVVPNPGRLPIAVSYDLTRPAFLEFVIYDIAGRIVRDLGTINDHSSLNGIFIWDGHSDQGLPVANGVYLLKTTIRYADNSGDRVQTKKIIVID